MKRFILFLYAFLCLCHTTKAQTVEVFKDGLMQVSVYMADSINFVDTGGVTEEDAIDWATAHLDSLADVVWNEMQASEEPNKRDPDMTREVFRTIGYNGRNVLIYKEASFMVDSVILDRLIDKALIEGKRSAVLIAGSYGAGKSYSVRANPEVQELVSRAGVVLDESFNYRPYLQYRLARLKEVGIDDQTIVVVHNDAKSSLHNVMDRYLRSGRPVGYYYFLSQYPRFVDYVKFLEENDLGTRRIYLENANNTTGGAIAVEEALKWDYNISSELQQEIAAMVLDFLAGCNADHAISPHDLWYLLF